MKLTEQQNEQMIEAMKLDIIDIATGAHRDMAFRGVGGWLQRSPAGETAVNYGDLSRLMSRSEWHTRSSGAPLWAHD